MDLPLEPSHCFACPVCTYGPGAPAALGDSTKVLTLLPTTIQKPWDSFITDTQAFTAHCCKKNFGISGSYNLSPFFFSSDKFWRAVEIAGRHLSSVGLTSSWHDLLSQYNCKLTLIMVCLSGFQKYCLDAPSNSLSVLNALRKAF